MKGLEKIFLIAIFVVPIVVCAIVLRDIWSSDSDDDTIDNNNGIIVDISDPYTEVDSGDTSIDVNLNDSGDEAESGDIRQMAGESFENKLGDPISKIYEDAKISAAVTNVYSESNENSEIVGKLEKFAVVTAQKFDQGWSRISGVDSNGVKVSGWTKTANVAYSNNASLNTTPSTQTGVVTAEPYLNVRLNPNTSATILTTINKGEKVNIQDSANGWYKVTVNGVTGWVSADYVK